MKKKIIIFLVMISFISIGCGIFLFIKNNELKQEKIEKIQKRELERDNLVKEIKSHYNKKVITNKECNLYKKNDKRYEKVGVISKDEILELEEININYNTKYFHIKELDLYIDYSCVDSSDLLKEENNRYKNYILFNENVISNKNVKLYRDEKIVYNLDYSINEEIVVKDENGYYIEYFGELLFINKEDVLKVVESNNTNIISACDVPVTVYHFIYLNDDYSCNEIICHSEEQIKSHFKYLSDNKFFTMNTTEMRLYLEGKIRVPENSILITIDDGARAEKFIPFLEEYKINATLFLVSSWYPLDKFFSSYLEVASHTHNLHNPGVCSGGQGSPIRCLDKNELIKDLKESRRTLNNTEAFCYPFYEYNDHAISVLKEVGFKIAFAGENRKAKYGDNLFKVPRITIHKNTSLDQYINYIN